VPRLGLIALEDTDGPKSISWAVDDDNATAPLIVDPLGATDARGGASALYPANLHVGQAVRTASLPARVDRAVVVEASADRAKLNTPLGDIEVPQYAAAPIVWPGVVPFADGPATSFVKLAEASPKFDALSRAKRFHARWVVLEVRAEYEKQGVSGATWVDCVLLNHQLAVVRRALDAPSVRWVLADEVGLGKSLEALMIWSALSAITPGLRCAISAPKALLFQWSIEVRRRTERRVLARRADDLAPIFDPTAPEKCFDTSNARGIVLLEHDSLPALSKHGAPLDMLIVDEAHTLNQGQRDAVERIVGRTKSVLLLTATPRETRRARGVIGQFEGFPWAASLVDPKWPPPEQTEEESDRARAERVSAALARARALGESLSALDGERARAARQRLRRETPLERVLRTRRASLPSGLVARRELVRIPVEYSEPELALLRAARALEPDALGAVVKQASSGWDTLAESSGAAELRSELSAVRPRGEERSLDAKREALLDLCAKIWLEDPSAKVVVRCEFAETRRRVRDALRDALLRGGLRATEEEECSQWSASGSIGPVAVLDGSQDAMLEGLRSGDADRDSMLANLWAFERSEQGSALVLVANDAAAAGLNLQFASALILYDVPWSPTVAQQWVGRLDRLGQRAGIVSVYSLTHPALPSDQLLDIYERLNIFNSRPTELSSELERAVLQLSSTISEKPWDARVQDALDQLERQSTVDESGSTLDLEGREAPDEEGMKRKLEGLASVLEACGLEVQRKDGDLQLLWPPQDTDELWLPRLSEGLRRRRRSTINPETAAIQSEGARALRVSTRRLGARRWIRAWNDDFFSPRHPLFADLEQDLLRDPSLALARLRVHRAKGVAPGTYMLALCRNFPEHGGAAIGWCASRRALADARLSDCLAEEWARMIDGLSRMTRLRVPLCVQRVALDLGRSAPISEEARDRLIECLSVAENGSTTIAASDVRRMLASLEMTSPTLDDLNAVRSAVDEFVRDARFEVDRLLATRRRAIEAWRDSGDMGKRQRAERERELKEAELLGELVDVARELAEFGATEAARQRVLAAAILEVRE
jgi:hypothetical protein